jgi:hypothetical protein
MKTITQIGSAVGLTLTLSACGTLYKMDVAAYSSTSDSLGNTYVILSADPKFTIGSPEFELHADQLERALDAKGFQRVSGDNLAEAALGIYLSTSISDPSKVFRYSAAPVYSESSTESMESANKDSSSTGRTKMVTNGMFDTLPGAPTETLDGYQQNGFATTVYTKQMNLIAVDLQRYLQDIQSRGRSDASPIEVWSVDIQCTGQPSSLSEVIPVMIAAAEPYIADETGDVVRVRLSETDKRVSRIKGE